MNENNSQLSLEQTIFQVSFIKWVIGVLTAVTLLLILFHILLVIVLPEFNRFYIQLLRFQVNLDKEGNLATWFNSLIFLFAAQVAFIIAWKVRQQSAEREYLNVAGWLGVGCVFFYLALDDASQIHDGLSWPLGQLARGIPLPLFTRLGPYAWIAILGLLGIVVLAIMFLFFWRTLWQLPKARWTMLLGVVLFLSNPVTELYESEQTIVPGREEAVFADELYGLDRDAWFQLEVASTIQETTELVAAISFLASFMFFGNYLMWVKTPSPQPSPYQGEGVVPSPQPSPYERERVVPSPFQGVG